MIFKSQRKAVRGRIGSHECKDCRAWADWRFAVKKDRKAANKSKQAWTAKLSESTDERVKYVQHDLVPYLSGGGTSKRGSYAPKTEVVATSGDLCAATIPIARFWRQDYFETEWDQVVTDGLQCLQDYLGPKAPDWLGVVLDVGAMPPGKPAGWQVCDTRAIVLRPDAPTDRL